MPTVLDLPRHAWANHPHFPQQVLLLGSHRQFRSLGQKLVDRAREGGDAVGILTVFDWWKSAMSNHERYEEHKLYPYLRHRFGISTGSMEEGHDALHVCDAAVRAAGEHGGVASGELVLALQDHQAELLDHLDHEEQVVIPGMVAVEPREFAEYSGHGLRWLIDNHAPVRQAS